MKVLLKTVNLKDDMPPVQEALLRLDRELAIASREGYRIIKLIHGYGSSGAGGDIRIAAQLHLKVKVTQGVIRACIFGENWTISDEQSWKIVRSYPELKQDRDLGKKNLGITLVVL